MPEIVLHYVKQCFNKGEKAIQLRKPFQQIWLKHLDTHKQKQREKNKPESKLDNYITINSY